MKRKYLLALILLSIINLNCERDDICPESTPTTPNLIMDAFDIINQEDSKNVFGLLISGVGTEDALPDYTAVSTKNIILPLKTTEDTTQYQFIKDYSINDNGTPNDTSDDFAEGNQDIITISYTREEIYVSRACGYKTIFKDVEISVENDTDNWIQLIQPINNPQSVEDETAAHFKLFH